MKAFITLIVAAAGGLFSLNALSECRDVKPTSADPIKESAMYVGTTVAVITSGVATLGSPARPGIMIVAGDLGCEYAGRIVEAVREEPVALLLGGHYYIITQMKLTSDVWQAFVQYAGPFGDRAVNNTRHQEEAGLSKLAALTVMPYSSTIGAVAKLFNKNGINGKHVAAVFAVANLPYVLLEEFSRKPLIAVGKTLDEAGRDVGDAAEQLAHQLEANFNGTLRQGEIIIREVPKTGQAVIDVLRRPFR